ncbi:MAG: PD-(D/E)XK nuclease family protein [bacterium]|nr:PD-(D/E)XK nuclease family protein [bacterium]
MVRDPYEAVWLSNTSISLFLKCPRAYYLGSVYKRPETGRRMGFIKPALALGQAVHETLEVLSDLPVEQRFDKPLNKRFEESWSKVSGKKGGFKSKEDEDEHKERGVEMIKRVSEKPGILLNKAVKIKMPDSSFPLPHFLFSEKENLILCGKIDWLEYLPETDSIHIVDFKTGKNDEKEESLQLPIYLLLANKLQPRKVQKGSFWYLDRNDEPVEVSMPSIEEAEEKILQVGKRVKLARQLRTFKCENGGCFVCRPYEIVFNGGGEFVGVSDSNQDMFVV